MMTDQNILISEQLKLSFWNNNNFFNNESCTVEYRIADLEVIVKLIITILCCS